MNKRQATLILIVTVFVQVFGVSRLQDDWWFEDDPLHFTYVQQHQQLWSHLIDLKTVRGFTGGRTLTPTLALSFWVDYWSAPATPRIAYLHQAAWIFVTAWLLWLSLRHLMPDEYALGATLWWLFTPSTVVVYEFLSTRHYLMGLTFTLAALLAAERSLVATLAWRRMTWLLCSVVSAFVAASCKEPYAAVSFWLVFWRFAAMRAWRSMVATVMGAIAFAAYRLWAVDLLHGSFDPGAGLQNLPESLWRLGYVLTGHEGGFFLALTSFVVMGWCLWRRCLDSRLVFWFTSAALLSLMTVLPVLDHLRFSYESPGAWYRVAFLCNTLFIAMVSWCLARLKRPRFATVFAVTTLIMAGYGAWLTTMKWDADKVRYKQEAEAFLEDPERLWFSRLPATWYLRGVHHLYRPETGPPKLIHWNMPGKLARIRLKDHQTIWRINERGEAVEDLNLLRRIRANAAANRRPLDQPILD